LPETETVATYVNKRTAHRWRTLAVMLGAVFCAFGSFWLLQAMRNADEAGPAGGAHNEPDYIVDNFSFVRMSDTGQPRYVVSGKRLTHRPLDDVSDVDQPVVQSMALEHPRMNMTANRARIRHGQNEVDLLGNVDVQRPATPKSQPMRLRTEELTVLPDDELMRTDKPVEMVLGSANIRGTGMLANNATQQVHVAGRGQIIYPPRANR
jgi:lipopolysaccharide export system protein LptC